MDAEVPEPSGGPEPLESEAPLGVDLAALSRPRVFSRVVTAIKADPRLKVAAVVVVALIGIVLALAVRPKTVIEPTGEATGERVRLPTTTTTTTIVKVKPVPPPATTSAPLVTAAPDNVDLSHPDAVPVVTIGLENNPETTDNASLGNPVGDTGPEAWPGGCCAPLTGLGYDNPAFANRPPLAVKINNSRQADPQSNLYRADLVYELRVEGTSRFIAVFHSRSVDVIGPIRSARTSDPPILHALGRPLVAFSGGNKTVYGAMIGAENNGWLINVGAKWFMRDYFRTKERVLPHNFYGHAERLWAERGGALLPVPQFDFLADGATNPTAVPIHFVQNLVGNVPSTFTWDAGSGYFLRDQYGRKHLDLQTGHRVARTSVVVLKTSYGTSGADARSPEAITSWQGGEAWVFTGGTYVHGRWGRGDTNETFHLLDDHEQKIKLAKGPIWVTLTDVNPTFG